MKIIHIWKQLHENGPYMETTFFHYRLGPIRWSILTTSALHLNVMAHSWNSLLALNTLTYTLLQDVTLFQSICAYAETLS